MDKQAPKTVPGQFVVKQEWCDCWCEVVGHSAGHSNSHLEYNYHGFHT